MKISQARIEEMDLVRKLFTEYQQWLGIDISFQNFETELHALPGCYAAPTGAIFLATENSKPIGCVAIRPFSENEAELKRMYVVPEVRGQGVAKALLRQAIEMASLQGYKSIVLDTLPNMEYAKKLYRQFGFVSTVPYYNSPISGAEYFLYVCS
jgi:carbonic anhydrase